MTEGLKTKKALILKTAREINVQKWTPAEIDQLRRRLVAEHGEAGKTGSDYIADVLKDAGQSVVLNLQEEAEEQYEEEFEDLLHFKTLVDAEVSIMRLDELMRKFRAHDEHAAVDRVLNVARLGKRRAEIWSAIFLALAGSESYVVDFFSHVDRVREFCKSHGIALREAAERCVVLPQPNQAELRQLFERFEGE